MTIEWTEDLSTSVVEIDNQHKEIFRKKNELHSACMMGKGKPEIRNAIQFLEAYVKTHFDTEEKCMQANAYPGIAAHKAEHMDFTKTIADLKKQFEAEGASLTVVIRTNLELSDWLKNHICKSDKNLAVYLTTGIRGRTLRDR